MKCFVLVCVLSLTAPCFAKTSELKHSYKESSLMVKSPSSIDSFVDDPYDTVMQPYLRVEPQNLEQFQLEEADMSDEMSHDVGSDWTYERLRDSVAEFNNGFFEYADKLASQIKINFMFRSKFMTCNSKANEKEQERRHSIQDKINLQEALEDLQGKYDTLEQALEKLEDINEDNKETITRLRAHRDRCVQSNSNRKKDIDSLRDEATELRRQISHARSNTG